MPGIEIDIYVDGVHMDRTTACGSEHLSTLEAEWGMLGLVSIAVVPRDVMTREVLPAVPFAQAQIARGARVADVEAAAA